MNKMINSRKEEGKKTERKNRIIEDEEKKKLKSY